MKRLALVLTAAMLLSTLPGCGSPAPTPTPVPPTTAPVRTQAPAATQPPAPTAAQPATPTVAPAAPKQGGKVVLAWNSQPDGLFPDYAATATASYAMSVLYDSLITTDLNGKLVGDLAESWTTSSDNLTWTFKLRKNVKWHDGVAFTAADIKFSYEFTADPAYTGSGFASVSRIAGAKEKRDGKATEIQGIKVVDDYTISFTTAEPYALFLETIASRFIMPVHVLKDVPVAKLAESSQSRTPIGTGPYRLDTWKRDDSLTFKAFDGYFGTKANLDTYIWKIKPELPTQVTELLAGGVDVVPSVSADDFPALKQNAKLKTIQVPGAMQYQSHFNFRKPFLKDVRVRRAMVYAVDRQAILKANAGGLGTVIVSPVYPGLPEFNPNLKGYPYDPAKAKDLLKEAGWWDSNNDGVVDAHGIPDVADGTAFRITMGSLTTKRHLPLAQIVQQYYKAVGIDAQIESVDFNTYYSTWFKGDNAKFFLAGSGWTNLLFHPQTEFESNFDSQGSNTKIDGYKNDALDALVRKAPTVFDPEQRKQIYWQIQEIIQDDVPTIFWTRDDTLGAFNKDLVLPKFGSLNDMFRSVPMWSWAK